MDNKKSFLTIGIMAHNEEKNIGLLLDTLLGQAKDTGIPFSITVVASGCTDRTCDIVRSYESSDNRIKLITEQQRTGKAKAINAFLSQSKGDFLIISSGDIIPSDNALRECMEVFSDVGVGMVGGRSVPRHSSGITAMLNNLLWELHHEVALRRPKLGEFIAFRNIVDKIPEKTAADEASIEALVTQKGFKIKYLPQVIIHNYGPKNSISFIRRRIRIFIGHLYVKQRMSYRVSTYNIVPLIFLVTKKIILERKKTFIILLLVCIEMYARIIAFFNFFIKKETFAIWER